MPGDDLLHRLDRDLLVALARQHVGDGVEADARLVVDALDQGAQLDHGLGNAGSPQQQRRVHLASLVALGVDFAPQRRGLEAQRLVAGEHRDPHGTLGDTRIAGHAGDVEIVLERRFQLTVAAGELGDQELVHDLLVEVRVGPVGRG
ncbi:MAG: hypothetical protein KDC48_20845, partial [Planctomycetes bacterium]|nr:hypothetical protein [Planctomycetota bacterium]